MEKINNCTDLVVGNMYSDRDGVNTLIYRGATGHLYNFEATEYDEEKGEYFGIGEEIRLTEREACKLFSL